MVIERRLLSVGEAATILGISTRSVYRALETGRIPGVVRISERLIRFDANQLQAFIDAGGYHPVTGASAAAVGRTG